MTTPARGSSVAPAAALWRAMSPNRMIDAGVDPADVHSLEARTSTGVAWDVAAEQLAQDQLDRAAAARAAGHGVTAQDAYRAAAANLLFAQMAFNFDAPRKLELYERFTAAVGSAAALASPPWERIVLPFGEGRLFGWLVRPPGPVAGTVVVFGGQSGWGAAYLRHAEELNRRGLVALLAEGPGQGESRFLGGVHLDVDVRAAYSTFVDDVQSRPGLGPCVGLWGNSLGGLYAATTAATDTRVTAVCVNGAPAAPRLLGFRTFDEQAAAMLGTDDPDRVQRNLDRIALQPGDRIEGALLVVHGGRDPIVSLADQQPFLDAAVGARTLKVWDDGEHTIYNHAAERTAYVADWFLDRFADAARTGSRP